MLEDLKWTIDKELKEIRRTIYEQIGIINKEIEIIKKLSRILRTEKYITWN